MFGPAWFLASRDFAHMFRARETWLWTFLMPILFFYFIGTVTGGGGLGGQETDPVAVWVPPAAGYLADHVTARIERLRYRVTRVRSPGDLHRYSRQLSFPENFTRRVLSGEAVQLDFRRTGSGLSGDYDEIRLKRAAYTTIAEMIVLAKERKEPTAEAFAALAAEPRVITLEVRPAGKLVQIPRGFDQSVPGTMVMFTMLVLLTTGGVTLVIERDRGILRRLASSPMPRGAVVLAKWGSRVALGIVQISFAMVVGTVLFHVNWGPNLPLLVVVLYAYAGLMAAISILLGTLAKSEAQMIAGGVIASNVLAALGGCWWPIEITPAWAQTLSLAIPTGWAMDALHKLVNFGAPASAVIPHLTGMAVAGVVVGWLASRSFRYQ